MDRKELNLNESFNKGIRNIFQIAAYIILFGNLLDLYKYAGENKILLYSNTANALITFYLLTGFYFKKIPIKVCYCVLIYTTIANIYIGKFISNISIDDPYRVFFFLRDTVFIVFMIALGAFVVNKMHSFIIGISYLLLLVIFTIYSKSHFLIDSLLLIIVVTSCFIGLTFYLVTLFEKALLDWQENSKMIGEQNTILSETNRIMQDRQQIIEEQSETLQKQADELQNKNRELSRLNDSKNMIFSIIAHDLKNPFNNILDYTELLRKNFNSLTEENRTKYFELIESNSSTTYHLLDNILNWARSQTDNIRWNPENITLNDIIQEVLDLYSDSIKNKEIKIEYSPDLLYEVLADKDTIYTAVRNLISNAIKYSYKGGKVSINIHDDKSNVNCSIKDHGIGIVQEKLESIFDLDKHLSTTITDGETGTGLGLIICKILITQNKGNIMVESKQNEGTIFTFTLPAANRKLS